MERGGAGTQSRRVASLARNRVAEQRVPDVGDDASVGVHPLHSMMPRARSFRPSLVGRLIREHSSPGELFLDPFCGKGTAVLEAVLLGSKAIGSDVGPDAAGTETRRAARRRRKEG